MNTKYIAYMIALLSFVIGTIGQIIGIVINHNQLKIPWLVSTLTGILLLSVMKRSAGDNVNSGLEHSLMTYSLIYIPSSILTVLANSISVVNFVSTSRTSIVILLLTNSVKVILISSFLFYFLKKFKELETEKIPILYNIAIITMVIWFARNLLSTLINAIYISNYVMAVAAFASGIIELAIKYLIIRVIFKVLKVKICKIDVKSVSNFTGYYLVFSSILSLNRSLVELFNYIKISSNNHFILGYQVSGIITGFVMLSTGLLIILKNRKSIVHD